MTTLQSILDDKNEGAVFFGDWHGKLSYAVKALERVIEKYPDIDVYYHVGDFGIWPGDDSYQHTLASMMESAGKVLVVTGGNHEDWNQWDKLTDNQTKPYIYPGNGLILLPKLWTWNHAETTFVSVGGAASIDRQWRIEGKSWWPQEGISEEVVLDIENAIHPNATVLITHEASDDPVLPVRQILGNPFLQMKWPQEDIIESEVQRRRVSRVVDAVQPRIHFHGHWHEPYVRHSNFTTVSLGADFSSYEENSYVLESFEGLQ